QPVVLSEMQGVRGSDPTPTVDRGPPAWRLNLLAVSGGVLSCNEVASRAPDAMLRSGATETHRYRPEERCSAKLSEACPGGLTRHVVIGRPAGAAEVDVGCSDAS